MPLESEIRRTPKRPGGSTGEIRPRRPFSSGEAEEEDEEQREREGKNGVGELDMLLASI